MEHTPLRPRPQPIADLTPENLKTLMRDIGEGPGWYSSAALYAWYVDLAKLDKLEPVSARKFGMVLRDLGYRPSTRRVHGKPSRGWFISRRAFRAGTPDNPIGDGSSGVGIEES